MSSLTHASNLVVWLKILSNGNGLLTCLVAEVVPERVCGQGTFCVPITNQNLSNIMKKILTIAIVLGSILIINPAKAAIILNLEGASSTPSLNSAEAVTIVPAPVSTISPASTPIPQSTLSPCPEPLPGQAIVLGQNGSCPTYSTAAPTGQVTIGINSSSAVPGNVSIQGVNSVTENLQAQINTLSQAIASLRSQIANVGIPATAPTPSATNNLQSQTNTLISSLTDRIDAMVITIQNGNSIIADLSRQLNDSRSQINALAQRVMALEASVNKMQSSITPPVPTSQPISVVPAPPTGVISAQPNSQTAPASYTPPQNLIIGMKGDQVGTLQQFLIDKGFLKIAAPTSYYGDLTKKALQDWQKSK